MCNQPRLQIVQRFATMNEARRQRMISRIKLEVSGRAAHGNGAAVRRR